MRPQIIPFFAIPMAFILIMAFIVPRRVTLRILAVFDRVNRPGDRIFVGFAALLMVTGVFAAIFALCFVPSLGTIVVVLSAIGSAIRPGRFFGTFRQAVEDYSTLVRQGIHNLIAS